ncbi:MULTISPECIES: cell division protein ZapA [unclassified Granulicatella]|uniref:cell division protein ZapA n=1 Tax=unclassified Granulicatella TaxID=2630493 RepID=UPI00107467F8|nr:MULTISPECIES: cell division protein ZapA [unclassified Granulicatella]MBF0780723.1 cell division protein ZapA [Granulicatella sp. 19428wC4_WM01]TFU94184.1 cell division protein ZapA [Granulicatella sp. WM01]
MDTGKRRVKVIIDAQKYVVVSQKSNEHVKTAAELVDEQYKQIKRLTNLAEKDAALLVALNTISKQIDLESEALQLKKKIHRLEQEIMDLKKPERILMRGGKDENDSIVISEQLSLEHIDGQDSSLFTQTGDEYVPAIYKKK